MDIGTVIKGLRLKRKSETGKKYTQEDLSKAIGISRSYISDIERGRVKDLDDSILNAIAEEFGITLEALKGNVGNDNKQISNNKPKTKLDSPAKLLYYILLQDPMVEHIGFNIESLDNKSKNKLVAYLLMDIKKRTKEIMTNENKQ